jgi:hypothetical protein
VPFGIDPALAQATAENGTEVNVWSPSSPTTPV